MMPRTTDGPPDDRLAAAAAAVLQLTAPVLDDLAELGRVAGQRVDLRRQPALSAPDDWDALEPLVTALLHQRELASGAGLAVQPGAADGAVPAMAWWVVRDGEVRPKQHVLNPRSDSFYDVTQARWFRVPSASGLRTLLAPYVDSWGTDDVTMTAAVPLVLDGAVVGVVAADLDVRAYLDRVEGIIAAAGATALLDEDDRVIVATHPRLEAGTRLLATDIGPVRERAGIDEFGWAVVRL